jgi:PAS domain S-box-containing protein
MGERYHSATRRGAVPEGFRRPESGLACDQPLKGKLRMPDQASTHLLSRLASALNHRSPEEALREALAIARDLGVVLAEDTDTPWLTLAEGARTLRLKWQPHSDGSEPKTELSQDESEVLKELLSLGLMRASEDEQLRRVRERMTMLSEASFEGLFFHVDGFVIDTNRRLAELSGYEESELLGDTLLSRCVTSEDLPTVLERMRTGYEGSYVVTAVRKDGSRFPAELQAKQGKLGDRPLRVAAVRDVTERERIEALLRESETRLRQLAETTFDVIVFSRRGVIVDILGAVERLHGYTREEMVGRHILEYVTEESAEQIEHMLSRELTGVYETTAIRKDGELVPVEVVAVNTTLHGEPVRMAALRDMREARRLAAERRALELAFERSQRLDSLGVLAGGVAHDFNNLLTAVLGNAELLERQLTEPALRAMAGSIVDASQRAAGLTAQMLAYAGRRELGPRASIDLGVLIADLHALLAATLSKKAQVTLALEPDSFVLGNRATLTQVLMNLLTNASDALGDAPGTIAIRTRRLSEPDARWITALGAKVGPGDWILLEVSDSGAGMEAAVQARIFEPFFSTKAAGHGLGLAACIGIVSSHGGAILVESEKGRGSVFSVLLPAAAPRVSEVASACGAQRPALKKVLLVDDEPLVRAHLRHAFQSAGYEVEEAESGQAALAAFARNRPGLVVLDMTMPDLSGIEVLQRIRALNTEVPVILASGYHDAVLDSQALGFQAFLAKPYTLAELFLAVERALTSR